MSSLLEIYQSDTRTVSLAFTDDGGVPVNVSGCLVYYVAKRNYSDSNANAVINKVVTGANAAAVTGLITMTFTTGDTSICIGDYSAGWVLRDTSSGVSSFNTDGLRILPSPMGYSP